MVPVALLKFSLLKHAAIDHHLFFGDFEAIPAAGDLPGGAEEVEFHNRRAGGVNFPMGLAVWSWGPGVVVKHREGEAPAEPGATVGRPFYPHVAASHERSNRSGGAIVARFNAKARRREFAKRR